MREFSRATHGRRRSTPATRSSARSSTRGTSSAGRACRASPSSTGKRSRRAPSSTWSASASSATASRRASSIRASSSTRTASSRRTGRGSTSSTGALLTSELLGREDEVKAAHRGVQGARRLRREQLPREAPRQEDALRAAPRSERITAQLHAPRRPRSIRQHVPWTRRVAEGEDDRARTARRSISSRGRASTAPSSCSSRTTRSAAAASLIGANVEPSVWERALKLAVVDPSIVQRRVPLAERDVPRGRRGGRALLLAPLHRARSVSVPRRDRAACSTRLSATTLCNVHAGAGTVPTFILEDATAARWRRST